MAVRGGRKRFQQYKQLQHCLNRNFNFKMYMFSSNFIPSYFPSHICFTKQFHRRQNLIMSLLPFSLQLGLDCAFNDVTVGWTSQI